MKPIAVSDGKDDDVDAVHEGPAHFRITDIEDQHIHSTRREISGWEETLELVILLCPVFPVREAVACHEKRPEAG
ncbi:MAG: hypothetical protein MZV64_62490 [Ignavibacteriales bacterium]|nr:hypothetical protein [Ignavibacteriales bacterium]